MAKSLSTNSNLCHDSASSHREKGINFKSSNVCHDSASSDLEKGVDFISSSAFLPLEIISDILSRLPVKSLLRFRCVCKQWRSLLTYDSHFITQHHNASLRRPMLIHALAELSRRVPLYELGPSGDIKDISFHIKFDGQGTFFLSNPVNGLVYVQGYLLNPFTRDVVQLPKSSRWGSYKYIGLGFESFTGRYKLVRLISAGCLGHCGCEVLTVGTQQWRFVGYTPCMIPSGHAIFLNGVVHWLTYMSYEPLHLSIFAFDIKDEKFQLASIPVAFPRGTSSNSVTLQELRGNICLLWVPRSSGSCFQRFSFRIWILKDYDKNEWEQKYYIDGSKLVNNCHSQTYANQIIAVQDGKILIQHSGVIYSYDFQSKCLCMLSFIPETWIGTWDRICPRCHVITESLVSPRNLLKQSISS